MNDEVTGKQSLFAGSLLLPVEILEADAVVEFAQALEFEHLLDPPACFEAVPLSVASTLDHFLEGGVILDLFPVIIIVVVQVFFTHGPIAQQGHNGSVNSAFLPDQEIKNID